MTARSALARLIAKEVRVLIANIFSGHAYAAVLRLL